MSAATRAVKGRFGSYSLAGEPLKVPGGARIYRVQDSPDVLYKELGRPRVGAEEVKRIDELVGVGAAFGQPDLSSSRGRIAWPRDAVVVRNKVVGVITPYPGDEFYDEPIGGVLMPRYLTHLRRPQAGVPVEIRLGLMRQLAGVLGLLEHARLVHGDIAAQNVLWRLDPSPSVFLIDCDGMHGTEVEGSDGATEGWADPRMEAEAIASHDMYSDWFALALAIWRVTTLRRGSPERGPHGVILPPEIPDPFREPLVRTFEDVMDPGPRPTPGEWIDALDQVLGSGRYRRRIDRLAASAEPPPPPPPPREPSPDPVVAAEPPPEVVPPRERRRRVRWTRSFACAAVLACLGVVGVSFLDSGPSVGQVRAEAAVAEWAAPRLEAERADAVCPEDSSLHAGARYACRVETPAGAVARVRVAVKRGGEAERRINLYAFRSRAIVSDLYDSYRYFLRDGYWGLDEISCPKSVSAKPGSRFTCRATFTDGAEGKIVGRMREEPGSYAWREVGTEIFGRGYALR